MRDEYDFSNGEKNPYIKEGKTIITIRLDTATVNYFKNLSKEINMPYQTIINSYLAECAAQGKKPVFNWQ